MKKGISERLRNRKKERGDKIFLDILRNAYGQTTVAPYAVRARPGAPVATPIRWKELSNSEITADKYNINNIFRRLGQIPDPWQNIDQKGISIKQLNSL